MSSQDSITQRINIQSTLTFLATTMISWQPVREVFVESPERNALLQRLFWLTLLLASGGAAFRALKIHWAFFPLLAIGVVMWTLRNMATTDAANALASGDPPVATDQSWYNYSLASARDALANVDRIKSPAVAVFGFSAIALVLIALLLIVSHILTFEVQGVFESLIPPAAVLAVSSALAPGQGGSGSSRVWAVAFVLAAGAHVIADADRKRRRRTRWLNSQRPHGLRSVAALAGFAVILVGLTSTLSSQLGNGPLNRRVDWRSGLPKVRQLDSPTISLRKRLVDLASTPMFHVDSRDDTGQPVATYWRQAALDRFDGTSWSQSARKYTRLEQGNDVPNDQPTASAGVVIRQRVTIDGLVDAWLPSAFQPIRLVKAPLGARVSVDPTTASLILSSKTTRELTYEVDAIVPTVPLSSPPRATDELSTDMTAIPDDVSSEVRALARKITAPAGNDVVGQARLLESFFQQNFTYSTDKTWSGDNPLDNFVLTDRTGYCEQFAGSFAAMARSVGIPARVAVGFTAGKAQADGSFVVTGENAHAWPEVLLADAGWIPFEPTPGRGFSRPDDITTPEAAVAPTTTPATPTTLPIIEPLIPVEPEKPQDRRWLTAAVVGVLLATAGLALWFLRPARAKQRQRQRHRRTLLAGVPGERVELEWAWWQLLESLDERESSRVPGPVPRSGAETSAALPSPTALPVSTAPTVSTAPPVSTAPRAAVAPASETSLTAAPTPREACRRAQRHLRPDELATMVRIADVVTAARFAPPGTVGAAALATATSDAHALGESLLTPPAAPGSASLATSR